MKVERKTGQVEFARIWCMTCTHKSSHSYSSLLLDFILWFLLVRLDQTAELHLLRFREHGDDLPFVGVVVLREGHRPRDLREDNMKIVFVCGDAWP